MRRIVPSTLVLLLVCAAWAGCLADRSSPEGDGAGEPFLLGHLRADGATAERDGATLVLTWEGVVGFGGSIHATGPFPVNDIREHTFEVDRNVGYVEMVLESVDGARLAAIIRDEDRRIACGATTSELDSCTTTVPPGQALTSYLIQLRREDDPPEPETEALYILRAVLHPVSDLPPNLPAAGLDPALTFTVADTGERGGEPTLGISSTGALIVVQGGQFDPPALRSLDDGRTWERVAPPVNPGSFDPMLALDPWTDRVYINHLGLWHTVHSWSDDLGETWTTNPVAGLGQGVMDAQTLAIGDAVPAPVESPLAPGHTLYLAWKDLAGAATEEEALERVAVSRSTDSGVTWTTTTVATLAQDGALGGGTVAADEEGHVYVSLRTGDGVAMAISGDHGETWRVVPVATRDETPDSRLSIAIDGAGNVYSTHQAGGGVRLSRSIDLGATWSEPVVVSPPSLTSVIFADAVAGDTGRVAVAYLASTDTDKGPDRADGWARWHVYVSVTEDALAPSPTWRTARVNALDDPVQIGTICTEGAACTNGARNHLDFIDVKVGPDGRVYVAYTDGCAEGCSTPQSSRDERGFVAVQQQGPRLFSEGAPWAAGTR